MDPTTFKPYLFTALYAWLCDHNANPHVIVQLSHPSVRIPADIPTNGDAITLNISPVSISRYNLNGTTISFDARFNGASRSLSFDVEAIVGIFDQNSKISHVFTPPPPAVKVGSQPATPAATTSNDSNVVPIDKSKKTSHLRVVK